MFFVLKKWKWKMFSKELTNRFPMTRCRSNDLRRTIKSSREKKHQFRSTCFKDEGNDRSNISLCFQCEETTYYIIIVKIRKVQTSNDNIDHFYLSYLKFRDHFSPLIISKHDEWVDRPVFSINDNCEKDIFVKAKKTKNKITAYDLFISL